MGNIAGLNAYDGLEDWHSKTETGPAKWNMKAGELEFASTAGLETGGTHYSRLFR